jgi:hypothetical protein
MYSRQPPLIIGFVDDLLFSSRIEGITESLGYPIIWRGRMDQVYLVEQENSRVQPGWPVPGWGWILLDHITRWHPTLMIFDLSNNMIPWQEWLPLLKSSPATRRIPVICYGSHIDTKAFRQATSAGADAVLARSRFLKELPGLLNKYSPILNSAELTETCDQKLSQAAINGLELFNRGAYFASHEFLEEAWRNDETPGRELYRAILQVAVAYLQIERRNYPGAVKMFLRLRQWIFPLPDICRGVNIARLRQDVNATYAEVINLGEDKIGEFDRSLFHPIEYDLLDSEGTNWGE